ncbi:MULTISPECIES: hypothetical protein [Bacillus]
MGTRMASRGIRSSSSTTVTISIKLWRNVACVFAAPNGLGTAPSFSAIVG